MQLEELSDIIHFSRNDDPAISLGVVLCHFGGGESFRHDGEKENETETAERTMAGRSTQKH
jgi:hypothetical protein